ncbi:DUF6296 family protein [Streptomyces sp. NPDC060065]|uniref:DUF6296 family protein n=1 Tax=Streptomyces sp. NPDC060065 TaxID=3347050 RepID=UPI0036CB88DF
METTDRYRLSFTHRRSGTGATTDEVIVERTDTVGPGGNPVYCDPTGILRAEISPAGEVADAGQRCLPGADGPLRRTASVSDRASLPGHRPGSRSDSLPTCMISRLSSACHCRTIRCQTVVHAARTLPTGIHPAGRNRIHSGGTTNLATAGHVVSATLAR